MNWFKKNWSIIFFNCIAIFLIILLTEFVLYVDTDKKSPFFILVKNSKHPEFSQDYESKSNNCVPLNEIKPYAFRCPTGLNFKSKPIVLFGCSFAWGVRNPGYNSFYYKLSNITKRPLYNRAFCGWSVQHMLYQLRRDDFYSKVPRSEYVIYVHIVEHKERMYKYSHIGKYKNDYFYDYLKYNEHFGKLYEEKRFKYIPYSRLWNWKILPLIAKIQESNSEKTFKLFEKHLLECRKEIDNHWGTNTKFIILSYTKKEKDFFTDDNIKELKQNRIDIIKTSDLTNIELYNAKYWISKNDYHPNEKAWDLITPLFVKKVREMYPDF